MNALRKDCKNIRKLLFPLLDAWLDPQEEAQVREHLEKCRECKKQLEMLQEIITVVRENEDALCPQSEELFMFANAGEDPDGRIATHVRTCETCQNFAEECKIFPPEETMPRPLLQKLTQVEQKGQPSRGRQGASQVAANNRVVAGRLRARSLMQSFFRIARKREGNVWDNVEKVSLNLYDILLNVFASPAPSFAPVFGVGRVSVLSPFGKVRPPIVFAWEPLEGTDRYRVSIEEAGWSQITTGTSLVVDDEFRIEYGREYHWSMEALRSDCRIDLISGFLFVPPKNEIEEIEQIEQQLDTVELEAHRLILLAAILEQRGFYQEAALKYQEAFETEPIAGIAFRIASCFDRLELEELRDRWNLEVLRLNEAARPTKHPK